MNHKFKLKIPYTLLVLFSWHCTGNNLGTNCFTQISKDLKSHAIVYNDIDSGIRFSVRKDNLVVIELDTPNSPNNLLNPATIKALSFVAGFLESTPNLKGAIFVSKKTHFHAGSSLDHMSHFESANKAMLESHEAQEVFNRFATLKIPTFAAINGNCIGGGFEFALSLKYRIASNNPKTRFWLPEIKRYGMIPGLGATQRLPRLIGIRNAFNIIATSRIVDLNEARDLHIIDKIIPQGEDFNNRAIEAARLIATAPERYKQNYLDLEHQNKGEVSSVLYTIEYDLAEVSGEKYYLLSRLLFTMGLGSQIGIDAGLMQESSVFGELSTQEKAKHVMKFIGDKK